MTEQEIRDNAPSGATHHNNGKYYMLKGDDLWRWIGKWLYLSNFNNPKEYVENFFKPL